MREAADYVTVLKTSDNNHVALAISVLESEGIPCQHPGKNHAGLLPGLTYIQVEVRVPADHAELARELLESIELPAANAITFRVPRDRRASGGCVGVAFGAALAFPFCAGGAYRSGWVFAIIGIPWLLGYILGRFQAGDICARPDCGGQLAVEAAICSKCGAPVRGVIKSPRDYLAAREELEGAPDLGSVEQEDVEEGGESREHRSAPK